MIKSPSFPPLKKGDEGGLKVWDGGASLAICRHSCPCLKHAGVNSSRNPEKTKSWIPHQVRNDRKK
ncbi:MAG: hypothetical protein A2235_01155 [Deltaproteobacteria bacterium RIFOXYA2_FULL_42_10]|nr:MAG: hypothetical protein A2090_06580 [Deltaproteobacteria bacterium GWD2_42_10]OGQ35467.1 MAG: hypothetical protein A3H47_01550 [Deltaproteobacteria bacterium RIFCSPLOWO2_02_FULL_42_39]OGQ76312.1 MAG: hypothetical protein A2235_01155 [Deltaproteobacteria bacterium RIFOXYA2_FULL_42_10]